MTISSGSDQLKIIQKEVVPLKNEATFSYEEEIWKYLAENMIEILDGFGCGNSLRH